jgi:uncharacterized membrane protein
MLMEVVFSFIVAHDRDTLGVVVTFTVALARTSRIRALEIGVGIVRGSADSRGERRRRRSFR